ncbi:MAG: glutaminase A [Tissierellia bacterium]|nr:glutaminase A [Tissierellia bacterium]
MILDFKLLNETVERVIESTEEFKTEGNVATYIPELANVDENNFGLAIVTVDGKTILKGDTELRFSMQSISKVISLIMALEDNGTDYVFERIGCECSPYAFNHVNTITTKAANPFVNAGAISTTAMIKGRDKEEKFQRFMDRIKKLSGDQGVTFLEKVYNSEMETTDTNRALFYILRSKGIFDLEMDDVLNRYVAGCSVGVNVVNLAKIAAVLANGGKCLETGDQLVEEDYVKITLAQMFTSGMYEESGKYQMTIGFPLKSGVSGGIMGVVPGKFGICTYSPRLDATGNSLRGIKVLEGLSKELGLSLFA